MPLRQVKSKHSTVIHDTPTKVCANHREPRRKKRKSLPPAASASPSASSCSAAAAAATAANMSVKKSSSPSESMVRSLSTFDSSSPSSSLLATTAVQMHNAAALVTLSCAESGVTTPGSAPCNKLADSTRLEGTPPASSLSDHHLHHQQQRQLLADAGGNMVRNNSFDSVNIHDGPHCCLMMPQSMPSAAHESGSQSREELPKSAHALMSMSAGSVAAVRPDQPDQSQAQGSMQHTIMLPVANHGLYSPGNDQLSTTSASTPCLSTSSCLGDPDPDPDPDPDRDPDLDADKANDAHLCPHAAASHIAAPCDCHSASPAPTSAGSAPVPDDAAVVEHDEHRGCQAKLCGEEEGEEGQGQGQGQAHVYAHAHHGHRQGQEEGQGQEEAQAHRRQGLRRQGQRPRRQGGQGQEQVQVQEEGEAQGRGQASRPGPASHATVYIDNNVGDPGHDHDHSHGDWNGLWSPVGNVNDDDHIMQLMSTAASGCSSHGTADSRLPLPNSSAPDGVQVPALLVSASASPSSGSTMAYVHHPRFNIAHPGPHGGIQDVDYDASAASRPMAHSNSDQGSFLARQHAHRSTFLEAIHMDLRPVFPSPSAQAQTPVMPSFYMNHGSGMMSSGHSLSLHAQAPRVSTNDGGTSTGTASTSCSKQDVDFCESLLNVDLNQHQVSGSNSDQRHILPSITSELNHYASSSASAPHAPGPQTSCSLDLRTSGSDGDTDVMMSLQDQAHHNSWMQMEQWMDSGHTTQLSSSLIHHRDSPSVVVHDSGSAAADSAHLQWSASSNTINPGSGSGSLISGCNYTNLTCPAPGPGSVGHGQVFCSALPYGSSLHMSLPASDYMQTLGSGCASPASAYVHFNRDHLFGAGPTRSLSSPNLAADVNANANAGEMGQVHGAGSSLGPGMRLPHATSLSQVAFMQSSPPAGPGSIASPHLPRSLSTSALHSERVPHSSAFEISNSGVHDDCGGLFSKTGSSSVHSGPMAHIVSTRHPPSVKRSLSFMQGPGAEDASCHSPGPKIPRLGSGSSPSVPVGTAPAPAALAETAAQTPGATSIGGSGPGPGSGAGSRGLPLPNLGNVTAAADNSAGAGASHVKTSSAFRPGIDDAAAQLSALLYTKSQTDIGNNAIAQYHKLAFQNSFYSSSNKMDNPSSNSSLAASLGAKHAARRRHGTATDPQSIAARTRRERFSDRIRILQSLVPNGERLDTVSMLGQTLEYVRFLQQQVWQLYNGTSTSLPGSGAGGAGSNVTATNLAAQVASAESLAASFLSSMAQRQAAAANTTASDSSHGANLSASPTQSDTAKLAAGGLDKWKLASASASGHGLAPHLQAECTQVA